MAQFLELPGLLWGTHKDRAQVLFFARREMAVVWDLSTVKDMAKPEFTNSIGSGYLSWCSAEDLVELLAKPDLAMLPRLTASPQLLHQPLGVLAHNSTCPRISIPDLTTTAERFSHPLVFSSCPFGVIILRDGKEQHKYFLCGHLQRSAQWSHDLICSLKAYSNVTVS